MGQGKAEVEQKASAIQRLRASLRAAARKNISRASKILIYATIIGAISQLASSDPAVIAALPNSIAGLVNGLNEMLQASPLLRGLVGMIGGDLTASVVERLARNGDLNGEEIAELIEEMLANSEARAALHTAANDVLENEAFKGELRQIVRAGVEDSGLLKTRKFVETASRAEEKAAERHEELIGLVQQMLVLIPASATRPIPMQKPRRAENFTGREEEVAQCVAGLAPGKAVTLVGSGGMGKSAIAAEVVWAIAPGNEPLERFPDGIVFYSFYGRPQAGVALEHLAASFGLEAQGEPQDVARRTLAGREALIVLDGTEEADDLRSVLDVCGSCGVLVTTQRRRQAVGEVVEVQPLPHEQSVALMRKWAGALADDEAAVERICDLLGNLPLAVRLVGRYLREQNEEAGEYLAWLEERPLEAMDHGERRERSVPLLIERSLAQVSEVAKRMVAVGGVLAFASFPRVLMAAALEMGEQEARRPLGELVDFGLLEREDGSYRLSHALVHTYARRRLEFSEGAGGNVSRYYVNVVQGVEAKDARGYGLSRDTWLHILALLEWLEERRRYGHLFFVSGNVREQLELRASTTIRMEICQLVVRVAQELGDGQMEGTWQISLGIAYRHRGLAHDAMNY